MRTTYLAKKLTFARARPFTCARNDPISLSFTVSCALLPLVTRMLGEGQIERLGGLCFLGSVSKSYTGRYHTQGFHFQTVMGHHTRVCPDTVGKLYMPMLCL